MGIAPINNFRVITEIKDYVIENWDEIFKNECVLDARYAKDALTSAIQNVKTSNFTQFKTYAPEVQLKGE